MPLVEMHIKRKFRGTSAEAKPTTGVSVGDEWVNTDTGETFVWTGTEWKTPIDPALATLIRWGRDVAPAWVHGGEVTAPAAGTALVSKTVSTGKAGYIYGFFISAGEANDFKINWTSGGASYSIRIPFSAKGAIHYADFIPMNEGLGADGGSSITITNVNAGSSGIVYQARLLYGEV
jgi:hypothetical protein